MLILLLCSVAEYAYTWKVTEKSDVYSFGVVLLEILTGRHPLDPTLPGAAHLVQWVITCRPSETSWTRAAADVQEMRQVLSVAALCVAPRADDRPAMTDVVALLEEIRRPAGSRDDATTKQQPSPAPPAARVSPVRSPHSRGRSSSSCSCAVSDYSA